jgi:hypothetical protein
MNAHFFDFAKQNQKNGHSFKIFLGGASRQGSFETASAGEGVLGRPAARSGAPPTALSGNQTSARVAEQVQGLKAI